jgi:predicted hydrocarbon binding protein
MKKSENTNKKLDEKEEDLRAQDEIQAEHSSIDEHYELSIFEKQYSEARKLFDRGEYPDCANQCNNLIRRILINIIDKNHRKLDLLHPQYSEKFKYISSVMHETQNKIKSLEELSLQKISELFDDKEVNYFQIAGNNYEKYSPLLNSFNFKHISDLIDYCQNKNKENPEVKLGVQQILSSITALLLARRQDMKVEQYHLLSNYEHLREEIKRIQDSHNKLSTVKSELFYVYQDEEQKYQTQVDKREFEWIRYRGMLINKHDESRNIAFKVETFDNILATIYDGINSQVKILNENLKNKKSEEDLRKIPKTIILNAGYLSGLKFGWKMHEIIQRQNDDETALDYSMVNSSGIRFKIKLSDNFVVYQRDEGHVNLCSFVAGYIQGVLEKVTQQPLIVQHLPTDCEQFEAGNNYCVFRLRTDIDKVKKIKEMVDKQYNDDLIPTVNNHDEESRATY